VGLFYQCIILIAPNKFLHLVAYSMPEFKRQGGRNMITDFRRMKLRTRLAICIRITVALLLVIFGIAQLVLPAKAQIVTCVDEAFRQC
jgi:hypothetical protein